MTSEPIEERLRRWFNSTGFPLEIESARAFRRASLAVEHSSAYVDPETEKGREIDLLVYHRDPTGCFNAFFAVECKSSDKPWIVLTNRGPHTRYGGLQIACLSTLARHAVGEAVIDYISIYTSVFGAFCGGYALKHAFAGQSDQAYAACTGALKAASWISSEEKLGLIFGFPTIVVNTPIFEYSESSSGQQYFTEVAESSFEFSAHWKHHQRAIVRIVSRAHLCDYARKCQSLSDQYRALFSKHIDKAFTSGL